MNVKCERCERPNAKIFSLRWTDLHADSKYTQTRIHAILGESHVEREKMMQKKLCQ